MDMTKDEKLKYIVENNWGNIAQFVSFSPDDINNPHHSYIKNNTQHLTAKESIIKLINSAYSKKVNVRSFSLLKMKGNALHFNKGIEDIEEILEIIKDNARNNKYSIVNENIDINDGGVSGVILNNIIEFSPNDTPKCVDKPGTCRLPKDIGFEIFNIVYGFKPDISFPSDYRVEFSIHPSRQGIYDEHTIIWEYENYKKNSNENKNIAISWPNNFSRFLGDKVFGLLIAYVLDFKVPFTTVISRYVAPFSFGYNTALKEKWIRTCPIEKEPGKYYTGDKWIDPFRLMNTEEKRGDKKMNIASILSQSAVNSVYSGASIIGKTDKEDVIEGVVGKGDSFMVGTESSVNLPKHLYNKIKRINNKFRSFYDQIGEVTIEWAYDGTDVWIIQLNQLKESAKNNIIVSGNPTQYIEFNVIEGLETLRSLIKKIKNDNIGVALKGDVGITSHFGDLLRLSSIPSYIISKNDK